MTSRIAAAFVATLLAALGLLSSESKPNTIEAARLNDLGVAYMNQQLFEKGLEVVPAGRGSRSQTGDCAPECRHRIPEPAESRRGQAAFEEALKQDPKNPNAWYGLGMLSKNTSDAQAAINAFKHVTEIDPNDADTWYFLGTAYVQGKQFPQAIDAFEHALKLNSLHASAEFGLSRAYQQSGDVDMPASI